MKRLFFALLLFHTLIAQTAKGQASPFPVVQPSASSQTLSRLNGGVITGKGFINATYTDTTAANLDSNHISHYPFAQITTADNAGWLRDATATRWIFFGGGGSGATIPGGPITTIPVVGTNPGTNLSGVDWIIATFYGLQPPTASLTGGGTFEFTSASTLTSSLNWGAGRQGNTAPLTSIVVNSISQTFSQPTAPGTVTGTQPVTVPTNTNTTYSNVVTATGGLTATATTTYTYKQKYYIGFVNNNNPSNADIIAATGGTVGGTFATTFVTAGTLSTVAGSNYIVFAYPASFGTATIKINGLAVGYNLTVRAFTNASGYISSYNIYVSPFPTNAGVEYQVL